MNDKRTIRKLYQTCVQSLLYNSRGTKIGTHHPRILEERERFQNRQKASERIGCHEKEAYERKANHAEESLQCHRETN